MSFMNAMRTYVQNVDEATKPRNAAYLRCHLALSLDGKAVLPLKLKCFAALLTYFDVTTDYLLGLSEVRKPEVFVRKRENPH